VWLTRIIVRIDPSTGEVLGSLDLSTLPEPADDEDAVLNGIAYDAASDRLWVTGKLWGSIYEIAR
jgi:glutaminyl-peptide cyclotransferase